MCWQTRSTIEASKDQAGALENALRECSRVAIERQAALEFHERLQELKEMYEIMAAPGRIGDGPREIAAVNEAQPILCEFIGRFFDVFERGLATIPLPQRDWLGALLGGITSHCWYKAGPSDKRGQHRPGMITKFIDPDLQWVEWS